MKKLIFGLFAIGSIYTFSACGSDDPVDNGSVSLDKTSITTEVGKTEKITPTLQGPAAQKTFNWSSQDNEIVSAANSDGGFGTITPNQIGETTVSYNSTDGTVGALCKIIVQARTNLLNAIYFKKDVSLTTLESNLPENYTLDATNSDNNKRIYNVLSNDGKIKQIIFLFSNDKLEKTVAVLNKDIAGIADEAKKYIEERFKLIDGLVDNISYYDTDTKWGRTNTNYTNTKVGVAYSTSSIATTLGITYGVVYTSK